MNKEIIAMAREAGMYETDAINRHEELERFAALAAAKEREACAQVCDEVAEKYQRLHHASAENIADECSAAIRARVKP